MFAVPSVKNRGEIVKAFRKTKIYNWRFIASLRRGLKHSDYFCD
jgi:hypothetical protein